MRILSVWLVGSVMLAPVSCDSTEETARRQQQTISKSKSVRPIAQKSSDIPKRTVKSSAGRSDDYIEPLVAAINLDDHFAAETTTQSHGRTTFGSLDHLLWDGFDFTSDNRASFHPHGEQVCASGCAASRHPTPELTQNKFQRMLNEFAQQPMSENSPALEKLLYFGRQAARWIARHGTKPLDAKRARFLRRELSRTHALVSFRIVDEHGVVRVHIPPTRVPLDRRHVFTMKVKDLPPLITSGTVKRVGLHHLWTRL